MGDYRPGGELTVSVPDGWTITSLTASPDAACQTAPLPIRCTVTAAQATTPYLLSITVVGPATGSPTRHNLVVGYHDNSGNTAQIYPLD
jgi:hypothetical protein